MKTNINPEASSIRRLQTAARQGQKGAMLMLGYWYQQGWNTKQDYRQAVYWYKKAITMGEPIAFMFLGQLYQHGQGVKKDGEKAAILFKKAIKMGVFAAAVHLGSLYDCGSTNFKPNKRLAIYWYKIAAGHKGYRGKLAKERLVELLKK